MEQGFQNDLSQGQGRWVHQSVRLEPSEGPGIGSDTATADAKVLDPPGREEDSDSIAQDIHRPAADVWVAAQPLLAAAEMKDRRGGSTSHGPDSAALRAEAVGRSAI